MKKRILAFFLAGIMTFSMVPTEVFAASANVEGIVEEEHGIEMEEGSRREESGEKIELPKTDLPEGASEEAQLPDMDAYGESDGETDFLEEARRRSLENTQEDSQVELESEEPADLASEEAGTPNQQSMEEWMPPMGGMERPEVVEISEETAESLGVMDVEEDADGTLMPRSTVLGSQKYDSSWDIYSTNYIYNRLKQNEKNFWDMLDQLLRGYLSGLQNAEKQLVQGKVYSITGKGVSYTYFGLTGERAGDIFLMFNYSNPQYYFLGNGYSSGGGAMFPIIYDGFANGNTRAAETAKVKAQIDAMVSQVKAGKTDVEKAKIAHDLICKKVLYDHTYQTNPHTLYHQSAYSVFCENYTVCAGYTKAFTVLMNGAGVDTISVTSSAHAWNMISLNDSWYHIDCTWDDVDGAYGEMIYLHFNRSTAMIMGELDQDGYHQPEPFYQGLTPDATQDSKATVTSIGTIGTPSQKAAAPTISKTNTAEGFIVTLSTSTPGADIYYTVDGVEPSSASSRSYRYTGAFEVENNTTVKAVAVCDTMWDSNITSNTLKKKTYTVKFNTRGYGTISSKKVVWGKTVKKPSNPKRSKYTFEGWYTDSKYTKKWNFNKAVTKNMTLYAKWKKVSVGKGSIKKLTNVSGKKIKVAINKVSGAKGYQVRYATNAKMKSAKSASTSSTAKTLTKLKKNRKYYVQVRAYKKDSRGKKVYGAWSGRKAITVRK